MRELIEKIKGDYKGIIFRILCLISLVLSTTIYVRLNEFRGKVYFIQTPLDVAIPFNKYFIVPYLYWYIYLWGGFIYFAVMNKRKYFKLLAGINAGMLICYVFYYLYPTFVARPAVPGNDIFSDLVNLIYRRDKPYNCFPSIHVMDAVMMAIYINREKTVNLKIKIFSAIISISIVLATLFVKQHYVYDAVAGAGIAYLLYYLLNSNEVLDWIRNRKENKGLQREAVQFDQEL